QASAQPRGPHVPRLWPRARARRHDGSPVGHELSRPAVRWRAHRGHAPPPEREGPGRGRDRVEPADRGDRPTWGRESSRACTGRDCHLDEGLIDGSKVRTRFLSIERPQVQDIDIAGADIIVSAGRGIQKKENLPLIEEFAKALGGVVGASRPLTDMDWLPKTRQVGQSGKTVRPKLYVACGISGAMQNVAGMKEASLVIAINTDPSAP